MPALTPQYLMDIESRMQRVTEREYTRLTQNPWWPTITKTRNTQVGREVLWWLLETARIRDQGEGGNIHFADLASVYTELKPKFAGEALKLTRPQFEDSDGNGVNLAAEWSAQIGAQMAYWPQELAAQFLMTGEDASLVRTYDKKAFFAVDHPVNPASTGAGTFSNVFTGASSATNPGALPIHDAIPIDTALANLQKAYGYISSIKMPNGTQPRRLRPRWLLAPPNLMFRALQLTGAKFIAQTTAGGGAAPGDISMIVQQLGFAVPIQVDELAGFESDRTYYIVAEQITASELGALIYLERDPFSIRYYGPQTDAELDRKDEFEWHCKGRNAMTPGHPFLLFKVKAT